MTRPVVGGRPTRPQMVKANRSRAADLIDRLDQARDSLEAAGQQTIELGGVEHVGGRGASAILEHAPLDRIWALRETLWGIALGKLPNTGPESRRPAAAGRQLEAIAAILDRLVGKPIQRQQVAAVHRIIVERG